MYIFPNWDYQVHEHKQIYNTFYLFPEKLNPVDIVTHDFQMNLFAQSQILSDESHVIHICCFQRDLKLS